MKEQRRKEYMNKNLQEEKARKAAKKQQGKKGKQRVSTRKQFKKHVDVASKVSEMTEHSNADVLCSSEVSGPSSSSTTVVSLHALSNKENRSY